jgi:hypothetical protein
MDEQREATIEFQGASLDASTDPELTVIKRALDELHLQLLSQEVNGHMVWTWVGHDEQFTDQVWSSREQALDYMEDVLARHG